MSSNNTIGAASAGQEEEIMKLPDVYLLMGPIGTGKSTALEAIRKKLDPARTTVAGGNYKAKFYYPFFEFRKIDRPGAATIDGVSPVEVAAYYTLLSAVSDAMKKPGNEILVMETAIMPFNGQNPIIDSDMVKGFIFLDAEEDLIVERRIKRGADSIVTSSEGVTDAQKDELRKMAKGQRNAYVKIMEDARKIGKLVASGSVSITESDTPDQVADMIIASVGKDWSKYLL